MIGHIKDLVNGPPSEGRSSHWPAVAHAHLKLHPACAACGATKDLDVHHVVPFHVDPSKELLESNLLTLCRLHHLDAHCGDWKLWNPQAVNRAIQHLADWLAARGG